MDDLRKTEAMIMRQMKAENRLRAQMAARFDALIAGRAGSVRAALRTSVSELALIAAYVPPSGNIVEGA